MKKFRRFIAAFLSLLMIFQISMVSSASVDLLSPSFILSFLPSPDYSVELLGGVKDPAPAFDVCSPSYLTFSSTDAFSISTDAESWNGYIYYSTDTVNWLPWSPGETPSTIKSSDYDITVPNHFLYVCGIENTVISNILNDCFWTITASSNVFCSGEINSLLNAEDPASGIMGTNCFAGLFFNNSCLKSAPSLSSTSLSPGCYAMMFGMCGGLTVAPELPATELQASCYSAMFMNCSSITYVPDLPATQATEKCYLSMFSGCTSLVSTPDIALSSTATNCCTNMFSGCTSLKNISSLNVSSLEQSCFSQMFSGCTNLTITESKTPDPSSPNNKPWIINYISNFGETAWNADMFKGTAGYTGTITTDKEYYLPLKNIKVDAVAEGTDSGNIIVTGSIGTYLYDRIRINPDGKTIKIGDMTYTAVKNADNAQYTYSFDGWYTKNGSGEWEPVTALPKYLTDDLSLKAKFSKVINKYDITIDTNNPEYLDEALPQDPITVDYGTKVSANRKTLTIGEGVGAKVITAKVKSDDAQYKYSFSWDNVPVDPAYVTGDVTITANVTRETKKYDVNVTVDTESDGYGTVNQSSVSGVDYGTSITSNGNTLSIGGTTITATPATDNAQYSYKFDHWEIPASTVTGTTNIKAVFSRSVNQYTVSVLTNNSSYGTVSTSEVKVDYGKAITANGAALSIGSTVVNATPAPSTAEYIYTFDKWTGLRTAVYDSHSVTANFIRTVKKYTVTYNSNGHGTAPTSQMVEVGETVPRPADPVAAGYTFNGWFTSQVCEPGYLWNFETGKMPASDLTLYAGWKANSYTITFDANGHGTAPEPITAIYGSKITKPTDPSATGYTFNGWYTDSTCSAANKWNFDVNTVPASNITLYAGWSINSYTVTFDANGHGTAPNPIIVAYGSKITKPSDPSASSYSFNGWFTDSTCTAANKWDFDVNTMPASNLTLYASWTYNGSGGGGGGGGGGSTATGVRTLNTVPTFSDFWVVDAKGVWRCFNPSTGQFVSSSWLCDDAITANGKNVWYLMNTDGTMLAANLVRDNSGNYYSLETSHYGYFGSLRYVNGTYDGIYMEFSQKHDGTFGAITNKEAIEALKAKYGVTEFKIGNENSVYTSTFPKI